jgi:hypothetical protein
MHFAFITALHGMTPLFVALCWLLLLLAAAASLKQFLAAAEDESAVVVVVQHVVKTSWRRGDSLIYVDSQHHLSASSTTTTAAADSNNHLNLRTTQREAAAVAAAEAIEPIRINCGSFFPYTDSQSRQWQKDNYFSRSGSGISLPHVSLKAFFAQDGRVFATTRFMLRRNKALVYRIPVPPNRQYNVFLYLPNNNDMQVMLQNKVVATDTIGNGYPTTNVTDDGMLSISITSTAPLVWPSIAAIEIYQLDNNAPAVAPTDSAVRVKIL